MSPSANVPNIFEDEPMNTSADVWSSDKKNNGTLPDIASIVEHSTSTVPVTSHAPGLVKV